MPEIVAYCRIVLDGYLVLAESSMTLSEAVKQPPNTYHWSFPLGFGGVHSIGVHVMFSERR